MVQKGNVSTAGIMAWTLTHQSVVFALAQESAKRMKRWHEGNDKARR
jgi:hypothetical protein